MMVDAMAGKPSSVERCVKLVPRRLGAVAGLLGLAGDVARHVVWYLAHQVDGRPRERS
jgi:hypothetical protein